MSKDARPDYLAQYQRWVVMPAQREIKPKAEKGGDVQPPLPIFGPPKKENRRMGIPFFGGGAENTQS